MGFKEYLADKNKDNQSRRKENFIDRQESLQTIDFMGVKGCQLCSDKVVQSCQGSLNRLSGILSLTGLWMFLA